MSSTARCRVLTPQNKINGSFLRNCLLALGATICILPLAIVRGWGVCMWAGTYERPGHAYICQLPCNGTVGCSNVARVILLWCYSPPTRLPRKWSAYIATVCQTGGAGGCSWVHYAGVYSGRWIVPFIMFQNCFRFDMVFRHVAPDPFVPPSPNGVDIDIRHIPGLPRVFQQESSEWESTVTSEIHMKSRKNCS